MWPWLTLLGCLVSLISSRIKAGAILVTLLFISILWALLLMANPVTFTRRVISMGSRLVRMLHMLLLAGRARSL